MICPEVSPEIAEEVVDEAQDFVRSLGAPARALLVAGLVSFELGAAARPTTIGRRFSQLSQREAAAYFESWWSSSLLPMSAFAQGLKSMLAMAYYEHPHVKEQLGYLPGPWIAERAAARQAAYADEIAAHEAELLEPNPLRRPRS